MKRIIISTEDFKRLCLIVNEASNIIASATIDIEKSKKVVRETKNSKVEKYKLSVDGLIKTRKPEHLKKKPRSVKQG